MSLKCKLASSMILEAGPHKKRTYLSLGTASTGALRTFLKKSEAEKKVVRNAVRCMLTVGILIREMGAGLIEFDLRKASESNFTQSCFTGWGGGIEFI